MLDDVSVVVRPGEVVGLAGLLGSGRSETVKTIFGALPLDSGEVKVDGRALTGRARPSRLRRKVALLPEDRKAEGIIPDLSIRDNIGLAALPQITRAGFVDDRRLDEIVEVFMRRLRIKASGPQQVVSELSGGNQQKVLLARLLCLEPRVLLLDEPTRGIDVGAKAEVQELIAELAAKGMAVVLISSELEEVVEGSDSVVVLRDGAQLGTLVGADISEDAIMDLIAGAAEQEQAAAAEPRRRSHDHGLAEGGLMSTTTTPTTDERTTAAPPPTPWSSRIGGPRGRLGPLGCASAASTSRSSSSSSSTSSPPRTPPLGTLQLYAVQTANGHHRLARHGPRHRHRRGGPVGGGDDGRRRGRHGAAVQPERRGAVRRSRSRSSSRSSRHPRRRRQRSRRRRRPRAADRRDPGHARRGRASRSSSPGAPSWRCSTRSSPPCARRRC